MISPFNRRPLGVDRRSWIRPRPLAVSLAGVVASAEAASAHEKWFYDATSLPTRWETALGLPAVAGVAVAVALTMAAWLVWRAGGGRDLIPGPELVRPKSIAG
jgi:hypothetical protein